MIVTLTEEELEELVGRAVERAVRTHTQQDATIADAARELQVSPRTVARLISTGELQIAKAGRRTLVRRVSLDRMLKRTA